MNPVFRDHQLCKQDSPLGSYLDSYAAEMSREGYPQQTVESQTVLIADFGRWLTKRQITAQGVRVELFPLYLRERARRRRPTGSESRALRRLLNLLVREGVVPEPATPAATPADQLGTEFRFYLQQERALASTTQSYYLTFVSEFLRERFGAGPVDLAGLRATDITGFVQRRATTIRSRRVQLMTTALRSFLGFVRYRGDIDKDLAAFA